MFLLRTSFNSSSYWYISVFHHIDPALLPYINLDKLGICSGIILSVGTSMDVLRTGPWPVTETLALATYRNDREAI
jgi:hypothetical protein